MRYKPTGKSFFEQRAKQFIQTKVRMKEIIWEIRIAILLLLVGHGLIASLFGTKTHAIF
jgi:hypothetical protein